jgi:hypothetical protein
MSNETISKDIIHQLVMINYTKDMIEQALGIDSQQRTKIMRGNRNISIDEFFTLLAFMNKKKSEHIPVFLGSLLETFENLYLKTPKNHWNEINKE